MHQGAEVLDLPSEYSGLISFRIDWFNFHTVQRTLKGLLQHHSLKASFLWCSGFFVVHLSSLHDSWKNHSFDYRTFVSKVMSLLFNMLSRFVLALLLRSTSFDFVATVTVHSDFGASGMYVSFRNNFIKYNHNLL